MDTHAAKIQELLDRERVLYARQVELIRHVTLAAGVRASGQARTAERTVAVSARA